MASARMHAISFLVFMFGVAVSAGALAQPTVTLSVGDAEAAEAGQGTASFTVTRSDDGNTAVQLNVYVAGSGSATLNSDFTVSGGIVAFSGSSFLVTIAPGQLSQTVTVTPQRDNIIEGVEDFTWTVVPPPAGQNEYLVGEPSSGAVTITDDVTEVTLTVDDAEAAEAGQGTASFTVTRSDNGNTALQLNVYVAGSGSATLNSDFTVSGGIVAFSGNSFLVTIAPGQLSRTVTVTPQRDNTIEGLEDFTWTVAPPAEPNSAYTIGEPAVGSITITDDVTEVTLAVDDAEAAEAGQGTASFTVTRSNSGNTAVQLNVYVNGSGSAMLNSDFTVSGGIVAFSGNSFLVTIAPGQLSRTVTVTALFDEVVEGNEDFTWTIVGPVEANNDYTIGNPFEGTTTIIDFVDLIFGDGFELP